MYNEHNQPSDLGLIEWETPCSESELEWHRQNLKRNLAWRNEKEGKSEAHQARENGVELVVV